MLQDEDYFRLLGQAGLIDDYKTPPCIASNLEDKPGLGKRECKVTVVQQTRDQRETEAFSDAKVAPVTSTKCDDGNI
jgi:hypothetical protein